jgi:hypothetical protein
MKLSGALLVVAGLLLAIGFALMDTTVSAGMTTVNNLGLMNTKQNGLIVGMALFLGGCVLYGFGSIRPKNEPQSVPSIQVDPEAVREGNRHVVILVGALFLILFLFTVAPRLLAMIQ